MNLLFFFIPKRFYIPHRFLKYFKISFFQFNNSIFSHFSHPLSQKQHNDMGSLHGQSACDDSNSSDTEPSDRGDGQNDGTMDSMDNQRSHSFPNAFLGLQGIPGLLPGPSGMGGDFGKSTSFALFLSFSFL